MSGEARMRGPGGDRVGRHVGREERRRGLGAADQGVRVAAGHGDGDEDAGLFAHQTGHEAEQTDHEQGEFQLNATLSPRCTFDIRERTGITICTFQSQLPKDWRIHMHCFTGGWDDCEAWIQDWPNMKFGFTPNFFQIELMRKIPLSKVLIETDAPYFLPRRFMQVSETDSSELLSSLTL